MSAGNLYPHSSCCRKVPDSFRIMGLWQLSYVWRHQKSCSVCVKQALNTHHWLVNVLVTWHVSYKITTLNIIKMLSLNSWKIGTQFRENIEWIFKQIRSNFGPIVFLDVEPVQTQRSCKDIFFFTTLIRQGKECSN